jgi:hypothetical protein
MLFRAQEPLLTGYSGDAEIYRFTWLRTFDHPVFIRIQNENGNIEVTVKKLSGAGGYDPGKIMLDSAFHASIGQWQEFKSILEESKFWGKRYAEGEIGFDGSQWILEGSLSGRYNFLDEWTPRGKSTVRELCEYLSNLSEIHEKHVY